MTHGGGETAPPDQRSARAHAGKNGSLIDLLALPQVIVPKIEGWNQHLQHLQHWSSSILTSWRQSGLNVFPIISGVTVAWTRPRGQRRPGCENMQPFPLIFWENVTGGTKFNCIAIAYVCAYVSIRIHKIFNFRLPRGKFSTAGTGSCRIISR